MTKILINRTPTSGNPPVNLSPGELSIEMSTPTRLWVGVPTAIDPSGRKLLNAIVDVGETPSSDRKQGDLWFESDTGILWLWYDDSTSSQWVQVNGAPSAASGGGGGGDFVLKTGDTMSGALTNSSSVSAGPSSGFLLNSIMALDRPAAYTRIHGEGAGGAMIAMGNYAANVTYYYDTAHIFGGRGGAQTFANFSSLGAQFSISAYFHNSAYITSAAPRLVINKNATGEASRILGSTGNAPRWLMDIGDTAPESGGSAGSDFSIYRYTDAGSLFYALNINRSTGYVTAQAGAYIGAPSGVYLAPASYGGTIILRPNGVSAVAGQVLITTAGTIVSESNGINSGGFTSVRTGVPTQAGHLANTGLGFTLNATGQHLVFTTDGISRGYFDYYSGAFTVYPPVASNYYGVTCTGATESAALIGWVTGQTVYGAVGAYFSGYAYSFYGNTGAYLAAGTWEASDARLKMVSGTLDPTEALATVNAILVKEFTPNSGTARTLLSGDVAATGLFGWVANDVEPLIPLAVRDVSVPPDDLLTRAALKGLPSVPTKGSVEADSLSGVTSLKALNDHYMIATLWAAVQKLSAEIEALKGVQR